MSPSSRRPRPTPAPVRRGVETIGRHFSAWRRLRGLTSAQLAERAQVSVDTLAALEHGKGGTSLENVLRIARALGIMEPVVAALDPYESDIGRLRADEQLPQRVREPRASGTKE